LGVGQALRYITLRYIMCVPSLFTCMLGVITPCLRKLNVIVFGRGAIIGAVMTEVTHAHSFTVR
jgi:hypothetical protein